MHDGMPYDPIQGHRQGHECLKAIEKESTVSPALDCFLLPETLISKLILTRTFTLLNALGSNLEAAEQIATSN